MSSQVKSEQDFWKSIAILISNYHIVNKKIFASVVDKVEKIANGSLVDLDINEVVTTNTTEACLHRSLQMDLKDCEGYKIQFKLLTKQLDHNIKALGIINFSSVSYTCRFLCSDYNDFVVIYANEDIIVKLLSNNLNVEKNTRWAEYVLKPKLFKWTQNGKIQDKQLKSLQLVDMEQYNDLYKKLKHKYALKILELWRKAKESTDPLKFIYEDLAIAAYLICLWRAISRIPNAFADLGCGNGLLVYILHAEGYKGYGYDLRARKLWTYYPTDVNLTELVIQPELFKLPANVNWLIGNHSDELSPWLPVLASTASYRMCYFILPCCAFEFSGAKFQRRNTNDSTYQDFLKYLKFISEECGFQTKLDRLKIPSTKRLALIGINRTYEETIYSDRCQNITDFVWKERLKYPVAKQSTSYIKLRNTVEAVNNCTQVDQHKLETIVLKIFNLILKHPNLPRQITDEEWESGGCMNIREIVKNFRKDELQTLKSECGGIKTLLRNRHEVFKICDSDLIAIRKPQLLDEPQRNISKLQTVKKRICFFKRNHPQGCPLSDTNCLFLH